MYFYLLIYLFFFTDESEHGDKCFFKEFAFAFIIPLTFSERVKAYV